VGSQPAVVANCASIPHDPLEIERLDPHKSHIPYDWALKDR
jgi:dTDP-4-dehydrorhamnose 3,5-epimerase